MLIQINGGDREIVEKSTLQELLAVLELPSDRIAIELNGTVVRREDWPNTHLAEGDRVEIVHFVGGGLQIFEL